MEGQEEWGGGGGEGGRAGWGRVGGVHFSKIMLTNSGKEKEEIILIHRLIVVSPVLICYHLYTEGSVCKISNHASSEVHESSQIGVEREGGKAFCGHSADSYQIRPMLARLPYPYTY